MKKLSALSLLALGLCLIPVVDAADPKATPQPAPKTSQPASTKAAPKTTTKAATKVDPKAAPKVDPKAATKVDPKATKESPAAEKPLVGILITRKDGNGFLNLKVADGHFTIVFLDKDKKETEGDFARAIIRYRKNLTNNQYILTRAADGKSLRAGGTPVRRPYILPALPVLLFKEGKDEVAEAYTVQFNQPMAGDGELIPADEMTPEQLKKAAK
ncbi:MAG: hypothetical protein IPL39_22650 [Opitutaceae bacterium]|nr:hypothetical protein [Opitutaceae bacterium]